MEQLTEADRSSLVATGAFIHANPSDPVHWGKGSVSVYERAVFLEPDFEVGPAPDLSVVVFRYRPDRPDADAVNAELQRRLQRD